MEDQIPIDHPTSVIPIFVTLVLLSVSLAPLATMAAICYFLLSLPLRRRERASLLLDLIETGLKDGRTLDATIISISASREASLGVPFHLLAAHLERARPISAALDEAPGVLPLRILAMLKAGAKIGDLQKIIPACRQSLNDAISQTRGAVNYLFLLAFLVTPATVFAFIAISIFVMPKFKEVAEIMLDTPPNGGITLIMEHRSLFVLFQLLLLFGLWLLALFYVAGPGWRFWFQFFLGSIPERVQYAMPWRRKRMQRDFASILAVLLDSGVPESDALELAGDCTANQVFQDRVARARTALQKGVKLSQAVEMIDDAGEFRWRITQAVGHEHGFVEAIAGWREALDAKAYQQEQAASQLLSTSLVLLNGIFVGIIALSVFTVLVSVVNAGLLW